MPYLGFTLSNAHQRDVSHIVGSDGITFKIDADLRQGKFFSVDAVLTTKPTPMIYSDNHLRDITPILLSTPPPAETFSVDAVLTTVPVYYRFDNNHLHTIQAILASSETGVQIKLDAILSSRLSKTFAIDATLTTIPVPYRYINTHLHDIIPIINSTASGVLFKADSRLVERYNKTFKLDAVLKSQQSFNILKCNKRPF